MTSQILGICWNLALSCLGFILFAKAADRRDGLFMILFAVFAVAALMFAGYMLTGLIPC